MDSTFSNIVQALKHLLSKKRQNNIDGHSLGWFQAKYLKHTSSSTLRSIKFHNYKIWYNNGPELYAGIDELFLTEIYKQDFAPNSLIIDCGSYIGLSLLYYKSICPSARIISFEPDKQNYGILLRNIETNNLNNIEALNKAVWIDNTEISFESSGNMGSKIVADGSASNNSVQAVRLKELLYQQVAFLKIDIEGAEFEVLQDISNELKNVRNLFIEYHGNFNEARKLTTILEILNEKGFSYYIKEAADIYKQPFLHHARKYQYDVQLNIFCFQLYVSVTS